MYSAMLRPELVPAQWILRASGGGAMPGEEKFSDGIKSVVEVGQQALGQGGRIKGDAGLQINPSISLHTNIATPFLTGRQNMLESVQDVRRRD